MRKRGKFEAANAPSYQQAFKNTKTELFRVYISSLVSLVLCCTMLMGTTMAWFTSDVTSSNNVITTGQLTVDLLFNDGVQAYSLREGDRQLFGAGDAKWKPNMVVVKNLTVENLGTLGAAYDLYFKPSEGAEHSGISEYFTVYVHDGMTSLSADATIEQIAANTEWKTVGTLAEIFSNNTKIFSGTLASGETETTHHTYGVAIHMDKDADTSIMGKTLMLDIELKAYQDDMPAPVNKEDLATTLSNGGNAVLAENISISTNLLMNGGNLDGNGKKIDASAVAASYDCAVTTAGGTVKNLTITGRSEGTRAIGSGSSGDVTLNQNLYLNHVSVDHVMYALNGGGNGAVKVDVQNSVLYGWCSFAGLTSLDFTNCTLGKGNSYDGYLVVYGNTSFNGCTFESFDMCADDSVQAGSTVTFTNCTNDGVLVTAENFRELFMCPGDDEDFNKLQSCTVIVDGTAVAWPAAQS